VAVAAAVVVKGIDFGWRKTAGGGAAPAPRRALLLTG